MTVLMALAVPLLVLAIFAVLGVRSRTRERPTGVPGRLASCPDSPNCVSTRGSGLGNSMPPLRYAGSQEEARLRLSGVLARMKGAGVVTNEAGYLRAEFRSTLLGFTDDVEFLFDDAHKRIDFRSASRVGYYDFGANRARMERISRHFGEASEGEPSGL